MRTELVGLEVGPVRGKIGFGSAVIGRCIDRWSAISNFSLSDKSMHPPRRAPREPVLDDSCYLNVASVIARSARFFTHGKRKHSKRLALQGWGDSGCCPQHASGERESQPSSTGRPWAEAPVQPAGYVRTSGFCYTIGRKGSVLQRAGLAKFRQTYQEVGFWLSKFVVFSDYRFNDLQLRRRGGFRNRESAGRRTKVSLRQWHTYHPQQCFGNERQQRPTNCEQNSLMKLWSTLASGGSFAFGEDPF